MISDQTEDTQQAKKPQEVSDKLAIAYFMYVGGAAGIGWHAVVNSFDYFDAKYPLQNTSFIFPIAPYIAQLMTTLVITQLSNVFSYSIRIITSLVILLAVTVFIPFEADIFRESDFGLNLIMLLLFILGFNNTLCYASIAGLTSKINGKYTAYFLIGVAIFGLLMNVLRETTILIFVPESDEDTACVLAYFLVTAFLIFGALIFHGFFIRSEFYKVYCAESDFSQVTQSFDEEIEAPFIEPAKLDQYSPKNLNTLLQVFKATKFYLFLILLACIQQNSVYPGVMLKKPVDVMAGHTKTVSMITAFSIFYIIGKKLGQYREHYNETPVYASVILRFVFIGFFIIQAITVDIPIFNTVWFGYLNIVLFAISMGFLNVSLFILAPEQVEGEKKEIAGFLTVFAINFGTMLGAFLSLTLKDIGVH